MKGKGLKDCYGKYMVSDFVWWLNNISEATPSAMMKKRTNGYGAMVQRM